MKAALASTFLVLALLSSGCTLNCTKIAVAVWDQAEIFSRFPPEGNLSGYHVDWIVVNGEVRGKHAQTMAPTVEFYVNADPDGEISWGWRSKGSHSDSETMDAMKKTFKDLGLPSPLYSGGFDWGCA
jgi:hypothetical protein